MSMLYVSPLIFFTYPPFVDVPQHLATLSVLRGLSDPSTGYAEKFLVEWFPNTNVGLFALDVLFRHMVSPLWEVKLFIIAYILSTALILLWIHRLVHGRWISAPWGVFLLFPFLYNSSLRLGLINYCMTISLFLLWLCIILDGIQDFLWKHCWIHCLLLGTIFLFHSQLYLFAGLCSIPVLFFLSDWKKRFRFCLGWMPSLLCFSFWYWKKFASSDGKIAFAGIDQGFGAEFVPVLGNIGSIVVHTIGFSRYVWWDKILLIFIGVMLWYWKPKHLFEGNNRAALVLWTIWLAVLCYFFLPLNIKLQFYISARMLILACFLSVILMASFRTHHSKRVIITATVLLPIVFFIKWVPFFQNVNASWTSAVQLLKQIPPHAKVLGLPFQQFEFEENDQEEHFPTHLHVASLYLLEQPGEIASNFMILPSSPIRYRHIETANIVLPDVRSNVKPWCALISGGWGSDSGYLLSRGTGAEWMSWLEATQKIQLIAQNGNWFLYQKIRPLILTNREIEGWWALLGCNKRIQPITNIWHIFKIDTRDTRRFDASVEWWRKQYGIWAGGQK
ncbi:MAG: hypothetical protein AB1547_11630 [Thermodesulfobacteriota bacterium]